METNNINLPFDKESIDKAAENIALKQIEIEAEKLKLKDLSEAISNIKLLTEQFINIENTDYTEKGYDSLIEEKQKKQQEQANKQNPANNINYNGNNRKVA